ncbi:MAG TPA: alpha/beta hydrolase [candidate division Zixibacteria bacterium]|nr:alpha/beta hydrolase [candidate division Zixibacteria bacterium]
MTITTTKIKGIKIRYQELGNKDKETLVLLHYGGASLGVWNGIIQFFEKEFHLVAPDLRCHGFSEMNVNDCHIDNMAEDIVGLMEKLGIEKAKIIGSSLGADVAISIAANFPKKVVCLVLDGGLYDIDGPDSKDQLIEKEEIEQAKNKLKEQILSRETNVYDSKEAFIESYKPRWEKYYPWTEIIEKAELDNLKETDEGKFTSTQTPDIIWKYIDPLYGLRFSDYFKRIHCPILWLPDEKECDNEVVKRNLQNYATNLKYHKIVTIEGSEHAYTCLIRPKEFSKEILAFFDEIKGL